MSHSTGSLGVEQLARELQMHRARVVELEAILGEGGASRDRREIAALGGGDARSLRASDLVGGAEVLERLATGMPLPDVLEHLVRTIEDQQEGMLGSILLLDEEGRHLRHGAAPNLPAVFTRAVDGVAIGPRVGSCGTAAFINAPVIVEDIATDPLWSDYKDLALTHGLRACWSYPIRSSAGRVLGTFAMYYDHVGGPTEQEMDLIRSAAHLAGVAIEGRRSEQALRREHCLLEILMNNVPHSIFFKDTEGRFTRINRALADFYGLADPADAVGKTDFDFYPAEYARQYRQDEQRVIETGATLAEQLERCPGRGGDIRWFSTTKSPILDGDDNVIGIVGISRDVTERKNVLEALAESESRLRTIIDLVPHMIFAKDAQGHLLLVNRAVADAYGMSVDDLIGRSHRDVHGDHAEVDRMLAIDRAVIASGRRRFDAAHRFTDSRGNTRIVQTTKIPFTEPGTKAPAVLGLAIDITELKASEEALRKARDEIEVRVWERTAELSEANRRLVQEIADREEAEKVLRESEERYRLLVEGVRYVAWEFDRDRRQFTFVSRHASTLLGHPHEDWLAPGFWFRHVHPEDRDEVIRRSRAHCERGEDHELEYRMIDRHGGVVWVKDITTVVAAGESGASRLRGVFIDITQRKEAEEQAQRHLAELAHATRLSTVGELAAGLAHEMNQPLAAIVNYAEACRLVLSSTHPDVEAVLRDLDEICGQAVRAAAITRWLKTFVEKTSPTVKVVTAAAIVDGVRGLLEPLLKRMGVTVKIDLQEPLPPLRVDTIQIEQALFNLIWNVAEAMNARGVGDRALSLSVAPGEDETLQFVLSSAGSGLDPALARQTFEPFFSTRPSGMGLGLPVTRTIVEAHGGRLWSKSDHPQGPRVGLTLPISTGNEDE